MERREIYNYLISHAEKAGVKFEYEQEVKGLFCLAIAL